MRSDDLFSQSPAPFIIPPERIVFCRNERRYLEEQCFEDQMTDDGNPSQFQFEVDDRMIGEDRRSELSCIEGIHDHRRIIGSHA